jgi:hypothetical protein
MNNKVNLFSDIFADHVGPAPIVVRAVVTNNNASMVGGVPQSSMKVEHYVLLSVLPKELQERVKTAVQAIVSGQ